MKLTVILISLGFMTFASETYSQTTRLSFEVKNVTIENVFKKIESLSEFKFAYNSSAINAQETISLNIQDQAISDILDEILKSGNFQYKIIDRYIIITDKNSLQSNDQNSQQSVKKLTGKVTDSSGATLPGVSVVVKGTTTGVITDSNGKFSLPNVPSDATLIFSFVGMKTQEISVGVKTSINVTLAEETIRLEEIVAIGYGTMKKSDLSGSVASVKSKDLVAYPSTELIQSLQGRAPGVQIQATNGDPASSYKVRIRGASSINASSDPLIVVDGFPGGGMPASEDIESVEILKDASATAIYGSRGANGVIMVTTKSGKVGKNKIEFNSSYSGQEVIKRLHLLQTSDFINYMNEMSPGLLSGSSYPNTDWQNEVFRKGGIQNYQLAMSGGNENVRYYVSGIIYDQDGIILDSKYKRYSIVSKLDIQAAKNLKVGINIFASRYISNGKVTQEWSGGAGQTGVMSATVLMPPTTSIYNEDGSYATSKLTGQESDNPVAIAKETALDNVGDNLQANFFGEYQIAENLKFRTTYGAQTWSSRNGYYLPSTTFGGRDVNGTASIQGYKSLDIINENYFTYNKKIKDVHDVALMAGYSYQKSRNESWFSMSQDFITDAFSFWNLGGGSVAKTPGSSLTESVLASFYGRVNYKLLDRYLITLNARYDGSSRFAKNNKWAFFPSGAIAWDVAKESFMKDQSQISQLKLRASYGITGNQAIGPYQSLAGLGTIPSVIINNTIVNAVAPSTVANNNLTWESTAQTDIGIDLGLLKQRISFVVDYYNKKTTNLLFSMPLPQYSGYSTMLKNIGSLENKGFEFTLSTVNFDKNLKWTTDFNLTLPKNKILELPDGQDIFVDVSPGHMVGLNNTQVLRQGQSMGQFFGYIYDGVYQQGDTFLPGAGFEQVAGGEKFRDINGRDANGKLTGLPDGQLNSDDRTIIGNPNPKLLWGLNNTLEYKGFDLNVFIQASQGNDIYSFTLFELELMSGYTNSTTRALDRWTPTHTNTDVPIATASRTRISSSRFVYDGSYIRFKNLSLGYKLPGSIVSMAGISSARIYISGQNLFTITKYPGYDPETTWMGASSNINLGLDYGSYPNAKSITVGVQLKF